MKAKVNTARLEGDYLSVAPPLSRIDELDNEYDVLANVPLPQKPSTTLKPAAVASQPQGNKRFNSAVEGGGANTNKGQVQVKTKKPLPDSPKEDREPIEMPRHGYVAVVVSGIRFISPREPILSHAGTRLGMAVASAIVEGPPMLQMLGADAASDIANMNAQHSTEGEPTDTTVVEFYCDRNPMIFPHILQYYRTGTLHLPHTMCWELVKDELEFWGIDETAVPECCMNSFRLHERHLVYTRMLQSLFYAEKMDYKRMNYNFLKMGSLYKFLYEVEQNWKSYAYFYFYMTLALLFAISFILQLNEFSRVGHPSTKETNSTHCLRFQPHNPRSNVKLYFLTHPHPSLRYFDVICTLWFTVDLILRFICYPSKVLFLCHAPNIIELICLAGNYFAYTIFELSDGHFWCNVNLLKTYLAVEVLRVFRLTRIPFFSPRYSWMRVLLLTLKQGFFELVLLISLVFVFVMFFGYLIVVPEMWQSTNQVVGQKSISANIYQPHQGMWYSIVTMATVGYGDLYPTSPLGYCIGAVCALTGVLFLSLQVPLISNRFNLLYLYAKQESNKITELKEQKEEHRRRIMEEERIRRERFWKKQFQHEENWEEVFRSGHVAAEESTNASHDIYPLDEQFRRAAGSDFGSVNPSAGGIHAVDPEQMIGSDETVANTAINRALAANNRQRRPTLAGPAKRTGKAVEVKG